MASLLPLKMASLLPLKMASLLPPGRPWQRAATTPLVSSSSGGGPGTTSFMLVSYHPQCPTELNVIRTSHTRGTRGSVQKPNVTTPKIFPPLYTLYHSQTNITRHNSRVVPADMDGWTKARARRRSAELVAGLCQEGGKSGHSLLVRYC